MKLLGVVVFAATTVSGMVAAQVAAPPTDLPTAAVQKAPKITPIPGGYFVSFPTLTAIGGVGVRGSLAGHYELAFDTTPEMLDAPVKPAADVGILTALADYWIFRGKPDAAIPIYRKAVALDPPVETKIMLLNNLALLVSSVQENHTEALKIIDSALAEDAENVSLIDSKGLIYLNAGELLLAEPLMRRAVELSCQGPIYVLHLAYTLDQLGNETESQGWFEKIQPILQASPHKMLKENRGMFDSLLMKYGQGMGRI